MSIVFIDTERVWRGGQEQLLSLLRGFAERGHRTYLVCHPRTLLAQRAEQAGVSVHPTAMPNEWALPAFWRVLALLRRVRPQIVAFNTPRPILLAGIASRLAGVRSRIIFRRVSFPLGRNFLTRLKYNWGIDGIIAISESIRQQLERGGVPAAKIRVVYEGIDLNDYPARPPAARGRSPTVVGTVAHMSAEKGHYFLVEAAALIPDVCERMRFVIVGDGECRADLEAQVRRLGLERCFEFAGFQDRISEYMRSFGLFVLPSLSEGLSSAILSAMAAGLPVIATNVGGIPELVQPWETGLLVAPADPLALAEAIQDLAAHPEEALRMGRNGRRRTEQHFTLERKIEETEQICLGFLKRRAATTEPAHA